MKFVLFTYLHQTDFGEETSLGYVQLKNLSTFKECRFATEYQLSSSMYVSFVPGCILSTLNGLMKLISITLILQILRGIAG